MTNEQQEQEFRAGDIVEAFGCRGVVASSGDLIFVRFNEDDRISTFQLDGKEIYWHKLPSLKFVSRPKKKVKKKIEWIIYFYENGGIDMVYGAQRNKPFNPDYIKAEHFQREIEVECE